MKQLDVKRLTKVALENALFVAAGATKTIRGVCSHDLLVTVTGEDGEAKLYTVVDRGQFTFEMRAETDTIVTFEGPTEAKLFVVMPEKKTTVVSDPTQKFTTVGHRPAIHPDVAALHYEMAVMRQNMTELSKERSQTLMKAQAADRAAQKKLREAAKEAAEKEKLQKQLKAEEAVNGDQE